MVKRITPTFELVKNKQLQKAIQKETDRASAILCGTYVDASLEAHFRNRLKANEELYRFNGPLGTFSSRILLANSLRWIDDDMTADLNTMRDIRNEFAHSLDHELNFKSQSIKAKCENLRAISLFFTRLRKMPKKKESFVLALLENIETTPRSCFEFTTDILIELLATPEVPPYLKYTSDLCDSLEKLALR